MLQGSRHLAPSPGVIALFAMVCALPVVAAPPTTLKPADTDAPVIQHADIPTIQPGTVQLDFTVSDQSALFSVILHWRFAGERAYQDIDFPTTESTFQAEIKDVNKDLEYWIEAYDEFGNGPALDGTAERPNRARLVHVTPPEPPKEEGKIPGPTPTPTPGPNPTPTPGPDTNVGDEITPEPPKPPEAVKPPEPPKPLVSDHVGRIRAARNLLPGRLDVELDGNFFWGSNFIYPGTSMNGEEGRLGLAFAPMDLIGFRVSSSFRRAQFTTTAANAGSLFPQTGASLDNWLISARVASPKLGIVRLAAEPSLAIPASSWCEPVNGTRTCGGAFVVSPGITGLASLDLPFLRAHINAGYQWDNSAKVAQIKSSTGETVSARPSNSDMFTLGLSSYDELSLGAAVEVPLGHFTPALLPFTPYVEWQLDVPVDRSAFANCKPADGKTCRKLPMVPVYGLWQMSDRIGGGLRIDFNELVQLDLGVEASLTAAGKGLTMPSATAQGTAAPLPVAGVPLPPPFLVRAALNWQFDLFAKAPPAEPPSAAAPKAAP